MIHNFSNNLSAFNAYNCKKINQSYSFSPKNSLIVFEVIPFLIHTNKKGFPGNQNEIPLAHGIYNYCPDEKNLKSIKGYFPDLVAEEESDSAHTPEIEALFIMGSIGSVGQSQKSDYDYWVCVDTKNIEAVKLEELTDKLSEIKKWANRENIETHFFITDSKKVQENDFGLSDKESVGSALGKILKEEFYRTMIHVAGKIPLWWIMPPGIDDKKYDQLKKELKKNNNPDPLNFIDMGNVTEISVDEYFGAALWQLNKALESPFKSSLKMALLESCITEKNLGELLCENLKRNIISSNVSEEETDSYYIMVHRVLDYYESIGKNETVELLRRCFYIKAGEFIDSSKQEERDVFKVKIIRKLVKQWNWSDSFLTENNNFKHWNYEKVTNLGKQLHDYMLETYKRLSDFSKEKPNLEHKITDTDRTVLGRKLFTFYSVKPGKILFVKKAFQEGLTLDQITFFVTYNRDRTPVWSVYQGNIPKHRIENSEKQLVKKSTDFASIVVWLVINKICNNKTSYYLIPNPIALSLQDIQLFIEELSSFFKTSPISELPLHNLLKNPVKQKIFIILNLFTQEWIKKIEQITLIYTTSWGEFFCETYSADDGLEKLCAYVKEIPKFVPSLTDLSYKIFIPRGENKSTLLKQINTLILKKTN